jgi:hypothetical protein
VVSFSTSRESSSCPFHDFFNLTQIGFCSVLRYAVVCAAENFKLGDKPTNEMLQLEVVRRLLGT